MRDQFEYDLSVEQETDEPEGSFATGDDEVDAEIVAKISADREWNEWAWCIVTVRATHPDLPDLEGIASLGGCSYRNAADFKTGGYYDDMVAEAGDDLERQIARLRTVLCASSLTVEG